MLAVMIFGKDQWKAIECDGSRICLGYLGIKFAKSDCTGWC